MTVFIENLAEFKLLVKSINHIHVDVNVQS